jgi:hypothetical protein
LLVQFIGEPCHIRTVLLRLAEDECNGTGFFQIGVSERAIA